MSPTPLLAFESLSLAFGPACVLDGVSLQIAPGEALGLVASGSGKSVAALAVISLSDPAARVTGGRILFEDEDPTSAKDSHLRQPRGCRIAYVFQHPRRALHPMRTAGRQILEVLKAHTTLPGAARKVRALVLHLGGIVEEGPADVLFDRPAHPYSERLAAAVPRVDAAPAPGESAGVASDRARPRRRLLSPRGPEGFRLMFHIQPFAEIQMAHGRRLLWRRRRSESR